MFIIWIDPAYSLCILRQKKFSLKKFTSILLSKWATTFFLIKCYFPNHCSSF